MMCCFYIDVRGVASHTQKGKSIDIVLQIAAKLHGYKESISNFILCKVGFRIDRDRIFAQICKIAPCNIHFW